MLLEAFHLPARVDPGGDLLLLSDQDRDAWDWRLIAVSLAALTEASQGDDLIPYHL